MKKGISLHIGINKLSTRRYRSEAVLSSPENDARAMAELARHEGYSEIQLLLNEEATKASFIQHFFNCAKVLNPGDTFLLSFSGHGGQQEDSNGDEPDLKDETWCFYDEYLVDDEIGDLWKVFKPRVRIIVVSSSCHSRSSLKPYPIGLPFWQSKESNKAAAKPVIYSYPADPQILASILHLSASDDRQQARDGEQLSRFIQLLLKIWDEGHFKGNYEELIRSINKEAGYLQTSGLAILGVEDPDFLNSIPFKL